MTVPHVPFAYSYQNLPEVFYQLTRPTPVNGAQMLAWNVSLAEELNLSTDVNLQDWAEYFSGGSLPKDVRSLSQAYSGHQFGHFVPLLGDGRAVLLGELADANGVVRDLQIKGSGLTRYSRRGDGRSALGPALREYLMSEAMFALKIPTTRTLAAIGSNDTVYREEGELPLGLTVRVASSHVRVGTFEYASQLEAENLKALADYCIQRHYPALVDKENAYFLFYQEVVRAQAQLMAQWMSVGFIHGVMNTDNMTVSGETIDFGPCAFMNQYDPLTVYSFIDKRGRYAYGRQPQIAQWNLNVLGVALSPLFAVNEEQGKQLLEEALRLYGDTFHDAWMGTMGQKLGFKQVQETQQELIFSFLTVLHEGQLDYTLSFRYLMEILEDKPSFSVAAFFSENQKLRKWVAEWRKALQDAGVNDSEALVVMALKNPIYIPRNHLVDKALQEAVKNKDMSFFKELNTVLQKPYTWQEGKETFLLPPQENEDIENTFCGT